MKNIPIQPDKGKVYKVEDKAIHLLVDVNQQFKKETRRWPAFIALVVIGGANLVLSSRLTLGPTWLILPLIAVLAIPAVIARLTGNHLLNHRLLIALCIVVTMEEIISIGLLLASLPDKTIAPFSLLRDAGLLWSTNIIIFALWYWQTDGGGPYARSHESCNNYRQKAELLFPQLTLIKDRPALADWRPSFTSYLFVAFNTSTAFSPTDTPVLSTKVKLISMVQASLSLVTLATLAARAINIL